MLPSRDGIREGWIGFYHDFYLPGQAWMAARAWGLWPPLLQPFEAQVGDIRVRSLSFSLEGDVDEAGHRFMHKALGDALL